MDSTELAQDKGETSARAKQGRLAGKWQPGQSGNPAGKKAGTRDGATLMREALASLDRSKGGIAGWLDKMRRTYPKEYLGFISRLLPREGTLTIKDERGFWELIDDLRQSKAEQHRAQIEASHARPALPAASLEPVPDVIDVESELVPVAKQGDQNPTV